jgi:hypothetical protein
VAGCCGGGNGKLTDSTAVAVPDEKRARQRGIRSTINSRKGYPCTLLVREKKKVSLDFSSCPGRCHRMFQSDDWVSIICFFISVRKQSIVGNAYISIDPQAMRFYYCLSTRAAKISFKSKLLF